MHSQHFSRAWALAALFPLLVTNTPAVTLQRVDGPFVLPADASLPAETLIIAESVEINGQAVDDAFFLAIGAGALRQPPGAGRIKLQGKFRNDVWAWGRHINLAGVIHDHARLAGTSVAIHGQVQGNALVAANNVHLARSSVLAAGAHIFGENVICEGAVTGGLTIVGGNVTLAGHCGGNVEVKARDLVILPGAVIDGDLDYWTPKTVIVPEHAAVKGRFRRLQSPAGKPAGKIIAALPLAIWGFLSSLCAGALLVLCCPVLAAGAGLAARHTPGRSLMSGLLLLAVAPALILLLMLSVIGLPAGLILGALTVMLVYLGKIVLAIALGLLLLRPPAQLTRRALINRLALGLLVLHAAAFPVSGLPVWMLAATLGAGALLRAKSLQIISATSCANKPDGL